MPRLPAVFLVLLLAGCATPPPPPPAAPPPPPAAAAPPLQIHTGQNDPAARYDQAVIRTVTADQEVQQILALNHVSQTLSLGLIIDPNGYVETGFSLKPGNDVPVRLLVAHLIYVNFGAFTPDMPNHKLGFLVPVGPATGPAPAENMLAYHMDHIVLYQPNPVLAARLGNVKPMADYAHQLSSTMDALFNALPPGTGANAALVVGVKPSGAVRAWVVDKDGNLPPDLQARIITAAEAVPPMPVQDGPVAFALVFNVWGGSTMPITGAPMPKAWFKGAPGTTDVPDGVFARIWP